MTEGKAGREAWVIEDHESLRQGLVRSLGASFETVHGCDSGTAARLLRGARPDLVVVDVSEGGESAALLEQLTRWGPQTAIIALTAHAPEADSDAAGIVGISKPFTAEHLDRALHRALDKRLER